MSALSRVARGLERGSFVLHQSKTSFMGSNPGRSRMYISAFLCLLYLV